MTITYFKNTKTGEEAAYLTKDLNGLIVAMNRKALGSALVEEVYPDTTHNRTCALNKKYENLTK